MIKYINCDKKNYLTVLNNLLFNKHKVDQKILKVVEKIIRDLKKNGDKALIKYEKKFSKNSTIKPNKKAINK